MASEEIKGLEPSKVRRLIIAGSIGLALGLPLMLLALMLALGAIGSQAVAAPTTSPPSPTPTVAGPTATPEPTEVPPTPTPQPVCGGPASMLILLIGTDNRADSYLYGLGDAVRLVRLDFVEKRIAMLSLPRDLRVQVPGLQAHGITHGKLSQAYFWGTEGMGYYSGAARGAGLVAEVLWTNFGLKVDHYLVANMSTFAKVVDALGGIYVYIPVTLDGRILPSMPDGTWLGFYLDETMENGYFPAGGHYLNGQQALAYARIRSMDNDFMRQERQHQVLMAIRDRLLSPDMLPAVPRLIDAFRGSVLTDLSLEQIAQISCLGPMLSAEDINLVVIPESEFQAGWSPEGEWSLFVDGAALGSRLAEFARLGEWPQAGP